MERTMSIPPFETALLHKERDQAIHSLSKKITGTIEKHKDPVGDAKRILAAF